MGDYEDTVYDNIIFGSIEVSSAGRSCEVTGSFTTKSGKTIELSYKGTFKE